ncbi:MAG: hypothetical protein ACFNUV_01455, partial [Capnocytophaga endodontalis]
GEALAEPDCSESDDNHLLLPVYEDRGDGEEYVRMPIPYATLHTLDRSCDASKNCKVLSKEPFDDSMFLLVNDKHINLSAMVCRNIYVNGNTKEK